MFRNYLFLLLSVLFIQACSSDDDGMEEVIEPVVMDVEVGGPDEPYSVYVNLREASQTKVGRDSWDLGFYSGADDYRVVLNPGAYIMAQALESNDLSAVSSQDTIGMSEKMDQFSIFNAVIQNPPPQWLEESTFWIDNSNGDISETAIEEVSSTDAENQVYIVNRGWSVNESPRGWMKIRVLRSGGGYELQYAELDSEEYQTAQISKDSDYNFTFFNFDSGIVSVEPPKDEWQLCFSSGLSLFNFRGFVVPYGFRDYVFHNRYGVEVAEVLYEDESVDILAEYESFDVSDLNTIDFNPEISTIGSGWRSVGNPQTGGETGVRSDRFYVIQDADGIHYKLLFAGMLNETGERGYPSVLFERITL